MAIVGQSNLFQAVVSGFQSNQFNAMNTIETSFIGHIAEATKEYNAITINNSKSQFLLSQTVGLALRKDEINSVTSLISASRAAVDTVEDYLGRLDTALTDLENGDITASEMKSTWDEITGLINLRSRYGEWAVEDGPFVGLRNLVDNAGERGDWDNEFLSYQGREPMYISGLDLSSDYTITEAGGDQWYSNTVSKDAADTAVLTQYTTYPGTPSGVTANNDDITLDSFDAATGDITFTSASTGTVSGTVTRGGLGLLDSWMYADFSTAAGIADARADVTEATSNVGIFDNDLEDREFNLSQRVTALTLGIADLNIAANNEVKELRSDKEVEILLLQTQWELAKINQGITGTIGSALIDGMFKSMERPKSMFELTA